MFDIGDLLYITTTPVLRLVEPLRKRRSPLVPKQHPLTAVETEWAHCPTCKEDTLHRVYIWRLEDSVTSECFWCGHAEEKS